MNVNYGPLYLSQNKNWSSTIKKIKVANETLNPSLRFLIRTCFKESSSNSKGNKCRMTLSGYAIMQLALVYLMFSCFRYFFYLGEVPSPRTNDDMNCFLGSNISSLIVKMLHNNQWVYCYNHFSCL